MEGEADFPLRHLPLVSGNEADVCRQSVFSEISDEKKVVADFVGQAPSSADGDVEQATKDEIGEVSKGVIRKEGACEYLGAKFCDSSLRIERQLTPSVPEEYLSSELVDSATIV